MRLSVHQRVAQPGQLDVWVGATDTAQAPQLQWRLDGAPAQPQVLRPLAVIRGPQLQGQPKRTFTGVVRFADPDPSTAHRIEVHANGAVKPAEVLARSLPQSVPPFGTPDKLRILLVSCYHGRTDDKHVATTVVHNVLKTKRPDLTLFLGDQVYLDLPTLQNFGESVDWLAEDFERKYVANWFPLASAMEAGFHAVLRAAPGVFSPDDHEYWNNYPHAAPFLQNTWRNADNWTRASIMMWNAFQLQHGVQPGEPVRIDWIDPLSIFILDTRTKRKLDFSQTMSATAAAKLEEWADDLVANPTKFGILVTGQSIFEKGVKWLQERAVDAVLADHGDYPRLIGAVRKVLNAKRPLLTVTGDVHWGRILTVQNSMFANRLYEVISSPTSLVEDIAQDLSQKVKGLFGKEPVGPWPKHSDAPSKDFGLEAFGPGFEFKTIHPQKGNQVVMLELGNIAGTAIHVEATFYPLNPSLKEKTHRFELR